jgi:aromatic-L-amino-acid decarboxylase
MKTDICLLGDAMKRKTSEPSAHTLGDMPGSEFQESAKKTIDWIASHFANIDRVPVLPDCRPGDIESRLPALPPKTGESMDRILADVDQVLMPGMTHWNHPGFFAYFSITGSYPGILGELFSAAFNTNAMLWKTCPSSVELEKVVLGWFRQMVGLPDSFRGIVYDTASVSTFHALAAAREQIPGANIREKGMAGRSELPPLRMYASTHAHSSVEKAAIALGFGQEGVRKIGVDKQFRMRTDELARAVAEDRKAGRLPFAVVGTVGTTSTTSIDPIPEIVRIAADEGLWCHVDAAYGGSAAVVPEMRHVLDGCSLADSIVINPHKWLFVPIDFSAFYTRKPEILKKAFSLVPDYLQTPDHPEADNPMDYGIQLGRRFRALKFWFVIRRFGWDGLADRIREHLRLAQQFAGWIEAHPSFTLAAPVPFSTVCFRFEPPGMTSPETLDRINEGLLESINASREVFLSHTRLDNAFVIRLAVGNIRTELRHVRRAWDIVQTCAEKMIKQSGI